MLIKDMQEEQNGKRKGSNMYIPAMLTQANKLWKILSRVIIIWNVMSEM